MTTDMMLTAVEELDFKRKRLWISGAPDLVEFVSTIYFRGQRLPSYLQPLVEFVQSDKPLKLLYGSTPRLYDSELRRPMESNYLFFRGSSSWKDFDGERKVVFMPARSAGISLSPTKLVVFDDEADWQP